MNEKLIDQVRTTGLKLTHKIMKRYMTSDEMPDAKSIQLIAGAVKSFYDMGSVKNSDDGGVMFTIECPRQEKPEE